MGQTGQLHHDHGRHLGKATGVTRAAVVCTIDIPFSVTTYDKIYRLLDVGKFQVVNPRVPEAKPPEILFAPTLLELQHVTGVPLVQQAADAAIEGPMVVVDLGESHPSCRDYVS